MSLLLGIFTTLLVLISLFMVLVILAQRAKSDGGVGAALGGGVTEAAFGAESGNVLSRATTYAAVAFFVLSFGLYLGHLHLHRVQLKEAAGGLPAMPELVAPGESNAIELPESLVVPPEQAPASVPSPSEVETPATTPPADAGASEATPAP